MVQAGYVTPERACCLLVMMVLRTYPPLFIPSVTPFSWLVGEWRVFVPCAVYLGDVQFVYDLGWVGRRAWLLQ